MNPLLMRALAAGAALGAIAAAPSAAYAQAVYTFSLPSQDLGRSLRQVARQTGSNIVFEPTVVRGRRAPALQGAHSLDAAIRQLIDGSGLEARRTSGGSWIVAPARSVGGPRAAAEDEEDGEIVVTGSHIRGAPNRTVPTRVVTRPEIEETGYATTQALIESLPQNFALTSEGSRNVGISDASTQGSAINLRGLGEGTTLTLVNGRRLALGYAGSAVDISGLSLAAVERVEILTDGASAIYGSDAIGGVVNFILRSDYDGAETSLRAGIAPGGINEYRASQVVGTSWNGGNVIAVGEYYHRDLLRATDRSFVPSTSQSGSILPRVDTYSLMLSGRHALNDALSVFADGYFSQRDTFAIGFIPRAESYRLDNAQYAATLGLDWRLTGDWRLELTGSLARNDLFRTVSSTLNGANGDLINEVVSDIVALEARATGSLISLPGGDVRVAIGGAYRWEDLSSRPRFSNGTGNAGNPIGIEQEVRSLYGEIYVPIVGTGNRMAGFERLELSLAGRYDDYNRFGSSFDPRVGIMWEPIPGARLRASYGTSYAAPKLADYNFASIRVFALNQPDPAAGNALRPQLLLLGTDVDSLGPQESTSWTLGLDLTPPPIPGLRLQANYYDISFRNRITLPPPASVMLGNPASFADLIIRNPTPQQIADALAEGQSGGNPPLLLVNPNTVVVIVDGRRRNLATTNTTGLDLNATYSMSRGLSRFNLALAASYIFKLENAVTPASVPFDSVGTIYNPTRLRFRGSAGWSRLGWAVNLAVNHTDDYVDNRIATALVPVSSYTTVDARIAYRFQESAPPVLRNLQVALAAQNLFNERPPRVAVVRTDFDLGYDPTNANPIGRMVSVEISKRW